MMFTKRYRGNNVCVAVLSMLFVIWLFVLLLFAS